MQVQLAAARANLAALEQRYKPDHPDVARARRQVAELQQKAGEETRTAAAAGADTPPPARVVVDATEQARRERIRGMAAEIESLDRQIAFKEAEERRVRGEIT